MYLYYNIPNPQGDVFKCLVLSNLQRYSVYVVRKQREEANPHICEGSRENTIDIYQSLCIE